MNSFGEEICIRMGINEWFVPQISEHCPVYNPRRLENRKIWFKRPGRASTFTPIVGTVHEWITSEDVTMARIDEFTGNCKISLVLSNRMVFEFSIKLSVSVIVSEVYS